MDPASSLVHLWAAPEALRSLATCFGTTDLAGKSAGRIFPTYGRSRSLVDNRSRIFGVPIADFF